MIRSTHGIPAFNARKEVAEGYDDALIKALAPRGAKFPDELISFLSLVVAAQEKRIAALEKSAKKAPKKAEN